MKKIWAGFAVLFSTVIFTGTAHAESLSCSGLWAGVESIMPVTAQLNTSSDGAPTVFKLTVNNAEFRGSMMAAAGGLYSFSVRRVGADLVLTGNVKFLTSISDPSKMGFSLHTANGTVEAILTCDSAK